MLEIPLSPWSPEPLSFTTCPGTLLFKDTGKGQRNHVAASRDQVSHAAGSWRALGQSCPDQPPWRAGGAAAQQNREARRGADTAPKIVS